MRNSIVNAILERPSMLTDAKFDGVNIHHIFIVPHVEASTFGVQFLTLLGIYFNFLHIELRTNTALRRLLVGWSILHRNLWYRVCGLCVCVCVCCVIP